MQHLNLLDPALLPPRRVLTAGLIVGSLALALTAVLVHAAMARDVLSRALVASLAPAAELPADTAPPEHLALQQRLAQTQALAQAMSLQDGLPQEPGAALQALLQALPAQAWLTEVELGPQGSLLLAGGTLDTRVLPAFAQAAAAAAGLQGRAVQVLRLRPRAPDAEGQTDGETSADMKPLPAHLFTLASTASSQGTP